MSVKPSEPHLVPYWIEHGLSNATIETQVFPLWSYAYLACLLLYTAIGDACRFVPVVVAGWSLCALGTRLLLLLAPASLRAAQATQWTFGSVSAAQVIFYAYIFALLPRLARAFRGGGGNDGKGGDEREGRYVFVTSVARAAVLCGHALSVPVGQALLSARLLSLRALFVASAAAIALGALLSLAFPWPQRRRQRRRRQRASAAAMALSPMLRDDAAAASDMVAPVAWLGACRRAAAWWWTRPHVRLFAVAYIVSVAVYDMALNYATNLFYAVDTAHDYNGYIMFGERAAGVLCAAAVSVNARRAAAAAPWLLPAALLLSGASLLLCGVAGASPSLLACALLYAAYGASAVVALTVSSSCLAASLNSTSLANARADDDADDDDVLRGADADGRGALRDDDVDDSGALNDNEADGSGVSRDDGADGSGALRGNDAPRYAALLGSHTVAGVALQSAIQWACSALGINLRAKFLCFGATLVATSLLGVVLACRATQPALVLLQKR